MVGIYYHIFPKIIQKSQVITSTKKLIKIKILYLKIKIKKKKVKNIDAREEFTNEIDCDLCILNGGNSIQSTNSNSLGDKIYNYLRFYFYFCYFILLHSIYFH